MPTSASRLTWPAAFAASHTQTSRASETTLAPAPTRPAPRSSAIASVTGPVTWSFAIP